MTLHILQQIQILLSSFIPCFGQYRSFLYFIDFFRGLVMLPGRKTVTQIFLNSDRTKHYTNFYRFLKTHKWDIIDMSKTLLQLIQIKLSENINNDEFFKDNMLFTLDSTFAQKTGKKFDGVASFFDHSSKPNTPKYIWAHCIFILASLFRINGKWFCLPLLSSIWFRKKTIEEQKLDEEFTPMLEKAVAMVLSVKACCKKKITVIADAFFSKSPFFAPLHEQGVFVLSRMRSDAVAYEPAAKPDKPGRGRPRKYGKKVKLRNLLKTETTSLLTAAKNGFTKEFHFVVKDLLLKNFPVPVRILVIEDIKPVILMSTNLGLDAKQMLEFYWGRFQIEFVIRDLKQHPGFEDYHVRRAEAINRFHNISILAYSLLKIIYLTDESIRSCVGELLDNPWRVNRPVFSFEQLLIFVRSQYYAEEYISKQQNPIKPAQQWEPEFFDTSGSSPIKEKIPEVINITEKGKVIKC